MNKRKIMRSMKSMARELDKMRVEFTENSALEKAKKTGETDYTEVLRDMTVIRNLNNIADEMVVATEIIMKSKGEIELDCEREGKTPLVKLMREFL